MRIHGLGIDIPDTQVDGSRRVLVGELERAQSLGFALAELSIPSLTVIMNGELIAQRVEAIKQAIAPFDVALFRACAGADQPGVPPGPGYGIPRAGGVRALLRRNWGGGPGLSQWLAGPGRGAYGIGAPAGR